MFKVVKCEVEHIKELIKEPMNHDLKDWENSGQPEKLVELTEAYTFLVGDQVMMTAGIVDMWKGRGYTWSVFSERVKDCPVTFYRGFRKWLHTAHSYRRLEMDTPVGFEIGRKRAAYLGFKLETPLARKYSPNGNDAEIYAWVRE